MRRAWESGHTNGVSSATSNGVSSAECGVSSEYGVGLN